MATDTKDRQPKQAEGMITLTIDGQKVTVPKGTKVIEAARSNGIDIPSFCYHPKLKVAGSCRMCYVEIEGRNGLAVSCATEVAPDMVVSTTSEAVLAGRRAILEFILANHPLDCPTCDKGGECDLQDLTVAHGIDSSRFDFQKNRFVDEGMTSTFDDLKIGPEIILNRNRCVLCYKCVRANQEVFGEFDLGVYERGNMTQIGSAPRHEVDNPFSGNLVEGCPVGALTNSDWRYKIRVWLTEKIESICPFGSSGSNIYLTKEDNQDKVYRVTSRANDQIDEGWLNDLTRYGYQIATSEERLPQPLVKKDGKQVPVSWDEALALIEERVNGIRKDKGSVCLGGWIAPSLDNRSLHYFNKFMRKTIGSNNIDYRMDQKMLSAEPSTLFDSLINQEPVIADIDSSDLIVTIGSDLLREHPNEYIHIRSAVTNNSARYFSFTPYEIKTADVAEGELVYRPGTEEVVLTALGLAAIEINAGSLRDVESFQSSVTPNLLEEASKLCGLDSDALKTVARALIESKKVSFFGGEILVRSSERELIALSLCNLNHLLGLNDKGQVALLARFANSKGAAKLGLVSAMSSETTEFLAGQWESLPEAQSCTTDRMLLNMRKEELDGMFIVGGNPIGLYPDRAFVKDGLEHLDFLVVADLFETETTAIADVVLPLSSWAEYDGEYVNLEGRTQAAHKAINPRFESKPGYEIISAISSRLGLELFGSFSEADKEIASLLKLKSNQILPNKIGEISFQTDELSKEYPVVLYVGDDAHHCAHLSEKSASLSNFCGGAYLELSRSLAEKFEITDGSSVRIESEMGKIVLPAKISKYMRGDVVFVPRNFSAVSVMSLVTRKHRVDRVKISPVAD